MLILLWLRTQVDTIGPAESFRTVETLVKPLSITWGDKENHYDIYDI